MPWHSCNQKPCAKCYQLFSTVYNLRSCNYMYRLPLLSKYFDVYIYPRQQRHIRGLRKGRWENQSNNLRVSLVPLLQISGSLRVSLLPSMQTLGSFSVSSGFFHSLLGFVFITALIFVQDVFKTVYNNPINVHKLQQWARPVNKNQVLSLKLTLYYNKQLYQLNTFQ